MRRNLNKIYYIHEKVKPQEHFENCAVETKENVIF